MITGRYDLKYTYDADIENYYGQFYQHSLKNKTRIYEYIIQATSSIGTIDDKPDFSVRYTDLPMSRIHVTQYDAPTIFANIGGRWTVAARGNERNVPSSCAS